jgi:nitrite reductase/ring-hydroxylating ferredoxin subunit
MERRIFLKNTCTICLAIGAGLTLSDLSSCASLPIYKTAIDENKISIPVSLFAQNNLQIIQPKDYAFDIALRKEKDGSYVALLMRCTHASNPLNSTGTGFYCTLHGSTFNAEGAVTKGPAAVALKKFPTEINSGNIIIHLT